MTCTHVPRSKLKITNTARPQTHTCIVLLTGTINEPHTPWLAIGCSIATGVVVAFAWTRNTHKEIATAVWKGAVGSILWGVSACRQRAIALDLRPLAVCLAGNVWSNWVRCEEICCFTGSHACLVEHPCLVTWNAAVPPYACANRLRNAVGVGTLHNCTAANISAPGAILLAGAGCCAIVALSAVERTGVSNARCASARHDITILWRCQAGVGTCIECAVVGGIPREASITCDRHQTSVVSRAARRTLIANNSGRTIAPADGAAEQRGREGVGGASLHWQRAVVAQRPVAGGGIACSRHHAQVGGGAASDARACCRTTCTVAGSPIEVVDGVVNDHC